MAILAFQAHCMKTKKKHQQNVTPVSIERSHLDLMLSIEASVYLGDLRSSYGHALMVLTK